MLGGNARVEAEARGEAEVEGPAGGRESVNSPLGVAELGTEGGVNVPLALLGVRGLRMPAGRSESRRKGRTPAPSVKGRMRCIERRGALLVVVPEGTWDMSESRSMWGCRLERRLL